MIGLLCFVVAVLASPFKSNIRLEAENATLRHQLVVLRRKLKGRARLTNTTAGSSFSSIAGFRRSFRYYNGVRTHRSLNKDAPVSRSVQRAGVISSGAILSGLHHHYIRI